MTCLTNGTIHLYIHALTLSINPSILSIYLTLLTIQLSFYGLFFCMQLNNMAKYELQSLPLFSLSLSFSLLVLSYQLLSDMTIENSLPLLLLLLLQLVSFGAKTINLLSFIMCTRSGAISTLLNLKRTKQYTIYTIFFGFYASFSIGAFCLRFARNKKRQKKSFPNAVCKCRATPLLANSLPTAKNNTKAKAKTAATKCILTLHR